MLKATVSLAIFAIAYSFGWAEAQHVIVLKNGRQITVQSYRTEGSMIKFPGLGGEIAISKDQIQAIRKAGEAEPTGAPSLALDRLPTPVGPEPAAPASKPSPAKPAPAPVKTEDQLAKQRDEEEAAYVQKVKDLTQQLNALRDEYSMATTGTKGPEPSFFTTDEAFKGFQDDLISRLRDAQNRAQGLQTGSAAQSPPFALDPPPAYTDKQKHLSDLRSRMMELEKERQSLIDEMKAKNFDAGSVYLE